MADDRAKAATTPSDAILSRLLALHPKLIDLSLDRMHALLARLDHPERALPPVIHIAGTNGKGSTLAMMRAGLESTGARVHAYTSPHLARFHERIRVAGTLIEEDALAAVLETCEAANGGAPITFFEITTAAALASFARTPAEWTLLEVGLGGRLDATNVVERPRLTVITPVSYDHQQFLGETLGEIAGEKAGILKPGVPCVVARQEPTAMAVIEARAAAVGAPLLIEGRDWTASAAATGVLFRDNAGEVALPPPALPGAHQIMNGGAAVAGLRALGYDDAACAAALRDATWPARLQRLEIGPLASLAAAEGVELWLDGTHNEAGAAAVADFFAELGGRAPAQLRLVSGMLSTKNVEACFRELGRVAHAVETVDIPDTNAALPAAAVAERARAAGLEATPRGTVEEAVAAAVAAVGRGGRVLICGSLYLAGMVLRENG
jgi:dihydrofolate synthase/folylpolyglutamate synthase